MDYQTILYSTDDAIATISLNRPERLNTIVPPMPEEIAAAVDTANLANDIKVIVLRGIGRSFVLVLILDQSLKQGMAMNTLPMANGTLVKT